MTAGGHPEPFRVPVPSARKERQRRLDRMRAADKNRLSSRFGYVPLRMPRVRWMFCSRCWGP